MEVSFFFGLDFCCTPQRSTKRFFCLLVNNIYICINNAWQLKIKTYLMQMPRKKLHITATICQYIKFDLTHLWYRQVIMSHM